MQCVALRHRATPHVDVFTLRCIAVPCVAARVAPHGIASDVNERD